MATRRRKARKKGPQPYTYYFRITEWHLHCSNNNVWKILKEKNAKDPFSQEVRKFEIEHRHYLSLEVELLNPVKNVIEGEIDICSSREVVLETDSYPDSIKYEQRPQDHAGGLLWSNWNAEHSYRTADGLLYVDECSFLALAQVLTSGRTVIVDLNGGEFYRNSARIRSVGWFTEGYPNTQDDLEYAIEQSAAAGCS